LTIQSTPVSGECPISGGTIARSAAWRALEITGTELSSFVFMLLIVRLLTPADYGIMATAGMFLAIAQALVIRGIPDALIQRQDLTQQHLDAAFWANLGLAISIAITMALLAEPAARLTAKPELAPVLRSLAPLILLFGCAAIYTAMFRKQMRYKALALRSLFATVAAGTIGVILASHNAGYWSLVGQIAVYAIVGLVAVMLSVPWRPGLRFTWPQLREVVTFGAPVLGSSLAESVARNSVTLILSLFLSSATMGYYFIAYRLSASISLFTYWSISEMCLPILSRLQHQPEAHRDAVYNIFRITGLVCLPCLTGMALVADSLVATLFGPHWSGSVLPLQIMTALVTLQAVQTIAGQMLVSAGRPGWQMRVMVWTAILTTALLLPTAFYGLVPALSAIGLANIATLPFIFRFLFRQFGLSGQRLLKEQMPVVLATVVMTAAVLATARLPPPDHSGLRLLVQVASGVLAFSVALCGFAPTLIRQLLRLRRGPAEKRREDCRVADAAGTSDGDGVLTDAARPGQILPL
jgi:O-antigen/teichoic acid export membrane protein